MSRTCIQPRCVLQCATTALACWWQRLFRQPQCAHPTNHAPQFELWNDAPFRMSRICTPRYVRCTQGTLWITQTGSSRDLILGAGETHLLRQGGAVVIQALQGHARFRIDQQH